MRDTATGRQRLEGFVFLVGFGLCIPAANWLIGHAGTVCVPHGPCLIPVAPGLMAPSGVLMIGLALVLRDLVQRRLGFLWAVAAILAGAALSALLAPPALVRGLRRRLPDLGAGRPGGVHARCSATGSWLAVVASSLVGLVVDSAVFLYLAFGNLDYLAGQVVGKAWMVLLTLPMIAWLRRRDARLGLSAA